MVVLQVRQIKNGEFKKSMTYKEILDISGKEIVRKARANLQRATTHGVRGKRYNSMASQNLYNSIGYSIVETQDGEELSYEYADYGYWIDQGRLKTKYKGTNWDASLRNWMALKGIDPKFLFVIKRNIHRNGFRGTKFLTKAVIEVQKNIDKIVDEHVDNMVDEYTNGW